MKIFRVLFLITFILLSFIVPSSTFASPYGACSYGTHLYNGQCVSSNSSSGGGGGSSSSTTSSVCTDQSPGSAPNLFQINTKGTTATLFFAPSKKPYSNYFVSFGDGAKSEGYGTGFSLSQSTGALKYDVFLLKPNSVYTFKVRAGNGCRAGSWSSTLAVKSGAKNSKYITKYYPKKQARIPRLTTFTNIIKSIFNR